MSTLIARSVLVASICTAAAAAGAACQITVDPAPLSDSGLADSGFADATASDAGAVADAQTDAATVDANVDAYVPRCSELGEAARTIVELTPAPMNVWSFSANEACAGIHVSEVATAYRCGYAGCNPSTLAALPQQVYPAAPVGFNTRVGLLANAANLFVSTGNYAPGNGSISVTGLNFTPAATTYYSALPSTLASSTMRRWGAGAIAEITTFGNNRGVDLYYLASGTNLRIMGTLNGRVAVAPIDATTAYAFNVGASASGPFGGLDKVTYASGALTRVAGLPPAAAQFPGNAWMSTVQTIVATSDHVLLLRKDELTGAQTLSKCANSDATPCATEVPLTAVDVSGISSNLYVAHDRVYALRTVAGVTNLVYCTGASLVANTCTWTTLRANLASTATISQWDHDADHLYTLTSDTRSTVERIAK